MTNGTFWYLLGVSAMGLALVCGIWWLGRDAGMGMVLGTAVALGSGAVAGDVVTSWQRRLSSSRWNTR